MRLCKAVAFLLVMLLALPAFAADKTDKVCLKDGSGDIYGTRESTDQAAAKQTAVNPNAYWEGMLRVYVVEHVSSMGWATDELYEFPFLAFAIDSAMISMTSADWDTTVTWDGSIYNYDHLQEDNIAVQAVLLDESSGMIEAAAMADPGVPGSNLAADGYTHTVFAEEGTATW